jgi:hypothetical protein
MIFTVHLTGEANGHHKPAIIRTTNIDAEDLHSVVRWIRMVLSTVGYERRVDSFRIIVNDQQVYHEPRVLSVVGAAISAL